MDFEDDIIDQIKPVNLKRKLMVKKATKNFHSGFIDLSEARRLHVHAAKEEKKTQRRIRRRIKSISSRRPPKVQAENKALKSETKLVIIA